MSFYFMKKERKILKWEYQFSIEESLSEKKKYMQRVNDYRKETIQTYVLIINHGIFGHFPSKVLEGNYNKKFLNYGGGTHTILAPKENSGP